MTGPRILFWDIETIQNIVASFTLYERHGLALSHRNLLQERYIVCAAWKWAHEKRVQTVSVLDDPKSYKKDTADDTFVLRKLHEVLSEADVIVGHNGDQYDIRFTEGRMLARGLPALPPICKIDTKKIAKRRFNLNSNRLDYLGRYLGLGEKKEIGGERWLEILKGGKKAVKAIKEMVAYNKVDILLLEKVFYKLQPYMGNAINRQLYTNERSGCTKCGSTKVQYRGTHCTKTQSFARFQCQSCGGWDHERTALKRTKITRRGL